MTVGSSIRTKKKYTKRRENGRELAVLGSSRLLSTFNILNLIVGQVNRPLNPITKLARGPSIHIHRTHGMPIRKMPIGKGHIPSRRLPLTPKLNRTNVPRCDSAARKCALVGDSYGDEERSDNLFAGMVR